MGATPTVANPTDFGLPDFLQTNEGPPDAKLGIGR